MLVFLCAAAAHAQLSGNAFSGTTTSSGLFGGRSLGQGVNPRSRNFLGTSSNQVEQAQTGAGEVTGGERFLRENRGPGAFVGADSGDASNFFSQLQGSGFIDSGLDQFARNRAQQFQGNQNQRTARTPLRPRLSLGFSYNGRSQTRVTGSIQTRLAKLRQLDTLEPVTVAMDSQTAVLRGRVANEHDRELVARIVLLEPGVRQVRNELAVGPPRPEPLPPAKDLPLEAPHSAPAPAPPVAPVPVEPPPVAPKAPRVLPDQ